jgi:hypothetical protein
VDSRGDRHAAAGGLEEDLYEASHEQREELMAPILMHSDDGELASASAVLRMRATNAEYDQPALADRSCQRAAALLRSRSSAPRTASAPDRPCRRLGHQRPAVEVSTGRRDAGRVDPSPDTVLVSVVLPGSDAGRTALRAFAEHGFAKSLQ